MIKNFCSLCGSEIKQEPNTMHDLPKIEETRQSITGDDIKVMAYVSFKCIVGFLCSNCRDMYVEKLLQCLAKSKKAAT